MKRQTDEPLESDVHKKTNRTTRNPLIGKRIKMWFESDKMYYEAIVKSHKGGETYDIMWVKEGQEEPMDLKEADNTEDVANEDRWSVIEPVYREDKESSDDVPEEKDDGDDYKENANDVQSDDDDDDDDHVDEK